MTIVDINTDLFFSCNVIDIVEECISHYSKIYKLDSIDLHNNIYFADAAYNIDFQSYIHAEITILSLLMKMMLTREKIYGTITVICKNRNTSYMIDDDGISIITGHKKKVIMRRS